MKTLKIVGIIILVLVALTMFGQYTRRHGNPLLGTPAPQIASTSAAAATPKQTDQTDKMLVLERVTCTRVAGDAQDVTRFRDRGMSQDDVDALIDQMSSLGDKGKQSYHLAAATIYAHPELDVKAVGDAVYKGCMQGMAER